MGVLSGDNGPISTPPWLCLGGLPYTAPGGLEPMRNPKVAVRKSGRTWARKARMLTRVGAAGAFFVTEPI